MQQPHGQAWHPVLPWDRVQSTSLRPSLHVPHSFAPIAAPGAFGHAMLFLPHKRIHRARCSALGSSAGLGEMAAGPRVWSCQQLNQRVSGYVMSFILDGNATRPSCFLKDVAHAKRCKNKNNNAKMKLIAQGWLAAAGPSSTRGQRPPQSRARSQL